MARHHGTLSAGTLAAEWYAASEAPMTAMLELADRCNETCVHCYQVQGQKGELQTDDWRAILDQLASMGVLFLVLSGGEVTLRKDFLPLVRYAREKRFVVKIYTNGLTMKRELAQALAREAVQEVQISLYSHRAEVHDWVTGVAGSFTRTTEGVRHLVDAGVQVVVKTPLMAVNSDEYEQFVALADDLGANFAVDANLISREDGEPDPHALRSNEEQLRRVLPTLSAQQQEDELPGDPASEKPCGACSGVHIEANGEMRPCGALPVSVGDAAREGVEGAYQSSTSQFIRSLRWATLHGCRECDLRRYCQRCHADALHEAGDALGPYEKACRRALLMYEARRGIAPVVTTGEGAQPGKGPFRRVGEGRFETRPDEFSPEDEHIRRQQPWVLAQPKQPPPRVELGQLVQLRRPGRKKSSTERIPRAAEDAWNT